MGSAGLAACPNARECANTSVIANTSTPEPGAEQFAHISLLLSLFGKTFYGVTASSDSTTTMSLMTPSVQLAAMVQRFDVLLSAPEAHFSFRQTEGASDVVVFD
jgi:hypothetical protein